MGQCLSTTHTSAEQNPQQNGGSSDIRKPHKENIPLSSKGSLLEASVRGDVQAVQTLLDTGSDINQTGTRGYTSLHHAVEQGHAGVVTLLLSRGARVNSRTERGYTSLQIASWRGHTDILRFILSKGAGVNAHDNDGYTGLQEAVQHGHMDIIQLLLRWGADVNSTDKDRFTCLHHAARWGNEKIVKLLLNWGADVTCRTNRGYTALLVAAQHGHVTTMQLLLSRGLALDDTDNGGYSSLHFAVQRGLNESVQFLLSKGINVNTLTKDGYTPLQLAYRGRHDNIIELLIKNGADLTLLRKDAASQLIKQGLTTRELSDQAHPVTIGNVPRAKIQSTTSYCERVAVKLILVGQTEAGKTSLLRTVQNQCSSLSPEGVAGRTTGIEMTVLNVKVHPDILCYVYDFGGQAEYYPLHQVFITPHCLFSLVVDLHKFCHNIAFDKDIAHFYFCICQRVISAVFQIVGTKTDLLTDAEVDECCSNILLKLHQLERDEIARLKARRRELQRALDLTENDASTDNHYKFQYLSGENVKTKLEEVDYQLKAENRPKIPHKVVTVSCKTYTGLNVWHNDVADTILKHRDLFPSLNVPDTWLKLSEEIEMKQSKFKESLTIDEFSTLCREFGIRNREEVMAAVQYHRLIGQILHYEHRTSLRDIVFINPEKILNGLSAIFSHMHFSEEFWAENDVIKSLTAGLRRIHRDNFRKYGITSRTVLEAFLHSKNIESNIDRVLKLMFQLDLCFSLVYSRTNIDLPLEDHYVIPTLLSHSDSSVLNDLWASNVEQSSVGEFIICMEMSTAFEPIGLFETITTRINPHLKKRCDIPKCTVAMCNEPGHTARLEMLPSGGDINSPRLLFRLRYPTGQHRSATNSVKIITGRMIDIMTNYPSVLWDLCVVCPSCVHSASPESAWKCVPAETSLFATQYDHTEMQCGRCEKDYEFVAGLPVPHDCINVYREAVFEKLSEAVCDKASDDWRFLARELFTYLDDADRAIEQIFFGQPEASLQTLTGLVLTRWRQQCAEQTPLSRLVAAVHAVHRLDILNDAHIGRDDVNEAVALVNNRIKQDKNEAMKRILLLLSYRLDMDKWKSVFRHLDPDILELNLLTDMLNIERIHDIRERVYAMLKTWRRKYASRATYDILVQALRVTSRQDLAGV